MSGIKFNFVTYDNGHPEDTVDHIVGKCSKCLSVGRDSGYSSLVWVKERSISKSKTKYTFQCLVCGTQHSGVIQNHDTTS